MPKQWENTQPSNAQKNNTTTVIYCNEENFESIRLDRYLFQRFPEYSRTYFQDIIEKKKVLVNDKVALKGSLILKKDDVITLSFIIRENFENVLPQEVPFDIIAIHEDFLIINKPAGLVVHTSTNNPSEVSLVHGLLHKFKEFEAFKDTDRPGIVHRLDRDTSGLMIVARHEQALMAFCNLFKLRKIGKTYLAVVYGTPQASGSIDYPIGRHQTKSYKMSHIGFGSKPALTKYNTLAYYKNSALVAANLITGRTHQIRVHFSAIGHGLLGDEIYGRTSKLIQRQALHSWKLAFDYKGTHYSYTCPVPKDMQELLASLKQDS